LERLLAAAPLPSPSPVLAGLIARALAGGDQPSGEEIVLRVSALERAGRVAEATELLGRAGAHEPRLLGPNALALLASERVDEACEVQLGEPDIATGTARREALLAQPIVPRREAMRRKRSSRFSLPTKEARTLSLLPPCWGSGSPPFRRA
jgi:hypothetical protein